MVAPGGLPPGTASPEWFPWPSRCAMLPMS